MPHAPHELADEFPQHVDRIRDLKQSNAHFARLCEQYHELNRSIHRAQTRVDAVTEAHEALLRRQRLSLKDEIARMLD